MVSRRTLFRLAAVAILLLGVADLFACAHLCPHSCPSGDDDHCLNCCRHLVALAPFVLTAGGETLLPPSKAQCKPPCREHARIYHPPRV